MEDLSVESALVFVNVLDVLVQLINGLLQAAVARRVIGHDRWRLVRIGLHGGDRRRIAIVNTCPLCICGDRSGVVALLQLAISSVALVLRHLIEGRSFVTNRYGAS